MPQLVGGVADDAVRVRGGVAVSELAGASDMQVAHQMGYSKIETTKNIYGHQFASDRAEILDAMNQAVSCLYAYEKPGDEVGEIGA